MVDPPSVTLTIERPDGRVSSEPLPGPGGGCRIGVGVPGHRSAVWRIWANKNKSDVYVAARTLAGRLKFSLHESGDWRHQWIVTPETEKFIRDGNRVIERWSRPAAGKGGWTKALSIWVPWHGVTDVPGDGQIEDGVIWLPSFGVDTAMGIHVVVARPDHGFVPVRGAMPITGFTLANGEVVLILIAKGPWGDDGRKMIADVRAKIRPTPGAIAAISRLESARIAMFASQNDGSRTVYDLAASTVIAPPDLTTREPGIPDESPL